MRTAEIKNDIEIAFICIAINVPISIHFKCKQIKKNAKVCHQHYHTTGRIIQRAPIKFPLSPTEKKELQRNRRKGRCAIWYQMMVPFATGHGLSITALPPCMPYMYDAALCIPIPITICYTISSIYIVFTSTVFHFCVTCPLWWATHTRSPLLLPNSPYTQIDFGVGYLPRLCQHFCY